MRIAILTTDMREAIPDCTDLQPRIGLAPKAFLEGFALLPEVEVHVVSCLKQPVPSPEKIAPNIFYHGVTVPRIGWLRTGYQGCIRAVRKKLREIRPDIVHGQGTERDCAISAVFSGHPNVITIHGNMRIIARLNHARTFSYEWLAARLEGFTIPRSDGVVCITNYTRAAVVDRAKKTWVLPNAVDPRFFEVRPEINPGRPPMILCVGAICLRKNQNVFIRALDPLAAKRKFRLLFVGGAQDEDTYCRDFSELVRARPWCKHAGTMGHDQLKLHLREASLLALPSLEDNCPMVVLEAAAAGVPVVAAKVGGVPDLITNGKTGLLCDPLDAASMKGAVEKLLIEREWGLQLAAEANRLARERYHPLVIARRHVEIYREVLGRR